MTANPSEKITTLENNIPSLRDILDHFPSTTFEFETTKDETEPKTLTLATHGQQLEHLVGGAEVDGILSVFSENGLSRYKLLSKEESEFVGHRVNAYSMFGGAAVGEGGEARVSFQSNGLAGYGDVVWVMPVSSSISKGGVVETFYNPTKNYEETKGMSGVSSEFGYYSPLGICLESSKMYASAVSYISRAMSALESPDARAGNILKELIFEQTASAVLGKQNNESYDDFSSRVLEASISDLTPEELREYLKKSLGEINDTINKILEDAHSLEDLSGVELYDPRVVCFVPESQYAGVISKINTSEGLTEEQKRFISRQFIKYEDGEDINLHNRIRELSSNPQEYALIVLENMRVYYGNPNLTVIDVTAMLMHDEKSLYGDRFGQPKGAVFNKYGVKPE